MKKKHLYKISLEHLQSPNEETSEKNELAFEFPNHDELFGIIETVKSKLDMSTEEAARLGLGIKLFGSVMLEHRKEALFATLFPHFSDFMKQLKQKN